MPTAAPKSAFPFLVSFSRADGPTVGGPAGLPIGIPCLAGVCDENIFPAVIPAGTVNGLRLFSTGEMLLGVGVRSVDGATIEESTRAIYDGILGVCADRPLYRIWNYVPKINEQTCDLEHYRAFCRGRSLAFEAGWGAEYKRFLPAGSAVGCDDNQLTCVFVAGRGAARHVENPEQIPAYEYPREHGPRAPSFSRASVARADGRDYVFISGTAAIKGHATIAPGALKEQIDCTVDNLRLISRASGSGDDLGQQGGWLRHFKVYLRHAEDLSAARRQLERTVFTPEDRVTWLRSDICRAALSIEIEATLVR